MRQRRARVDDDQGFTLVELLVVVIILGVLAAIALPVFLHQRDKARHGAVGSDLRNAATAQVAYLTNDRESYAGDADDLADEVKFGPSLGVEFTEIRVRGGDRFCMVAHHQQAASAHFFFDSDDPRPQPGTGATHCSGISGAGWDS